MVWTLLRKRTQWKRKQIVSLVGECDAIDGFKALNSAEENIVKKSVLQRRLSGKEKRRGKSDRDEDRKLSKLFPNTEGLLKEKRHSRGKDSSKCGGCVLTV